jgi:hypothetical protein
MESHSSRPNAPVFTLEGLESSLAERYPAVADWNVLKHPGLIHMRHDSNLSTVGDRTNVLTLAY